MRNEIEYNSVKDVIDEIIKELTKQSSASVETHGPQTKNGIISNALIVKVNKNPDLSSDVLELLHKGEKVIILEMVNKLFYKVITKKNSVAYIF